MIRKNLHWLIYILFIGSCAKQTSPTGGPKDTIPPALVSAIPGQGTINFRGENLKLEFSELITLSNAREQIIITPTIGKEFEATVKKNTVTLAFNAPLEDSTTYTFNFRESVQDITEKNPARNLQLAISTGTYIDSLSISGKVYDLLTGKEAEDATVAIHIPNDTFSILKHPAIYFTKTNKTGQYRIDNLKAQTYYAYAMADKNRNLIADSRSEAYGFLKEPIRLTTDTANINIPLIRLDTRPLAITSARPYNTYFNIKATKNLKDFQLAATDSSHLSYGLGDDPASIKVYNTLDSQDSIAIRLIAFDSVGNKLDTLLHAKFSNRDVDPESFNYNITKSSLNASKGILRTTFTFTKPLKEINFDSLFFRVDSATTIAFSRDDLHYEQATKQLTISKHVDKALFTQPDPAEQLMVPSKQSVAPSAPTQINELYLGRGVFISVENDSSQRAIQKITPLQLNQMSVILFDIRTDAPSFIVQLVDQNLNVLHEKININKSQFEDLQSGQYSLRLIIDRNGNGEWDPGNYDEREEPEPIIYYREGEKNSPIINLKANWELGPLLITS